MPRSITQITVFLASPGDVTKERAAVRKAAEEVNRTTGEHDGFVLVVKGWETHTRPAATKKGRAQDAIFEQIGAYDIFVGIMWARVGTPTGKAASGTIEEYEAARLQWSRRRKHKPSVMFYFRRTLTTAIDALNADQLKAVQTFKKRVFQNGLAREYGTVPEFEGLLREHLTKEARAILKQFGAPPKSRRSSAATSSAKVKAPAAQPTPKKVTTQKKSPRKTSREPRLTVPDVPRLLTEADREKFGRNTLATTLREFRATANVFNDKHPDAKITVKKEGDNAFTAVGEANGKHVISARIRLEAPTWGTSWTLHYETGQPGYSSDGTLHYQTETRVSTTDDGYTLAYSAPYEVFQNGRDQLDEPLDVARAFWDRFVRPFNARR